MMFDTGDVGENLAQLWASQGGFTANPVRRDKFGWDFCLQSLGGHSGLSASLDRRPPQLTCWMQVKTTVVGSTSVSISLSNWERMVKDPFPWFVLRIELDTDGQAKDAFLIHIGEDWIERAMRRLRQANVAGEGDLSNLTMDLTWKVDEKLADPIPLDLTRKILAYVGTDGDYVVRKATFRKNVGYGRERKQITLTTGLGPKAEDWQLGVDFAIGLIKRLPINAFVLRDIRFDIPELLEEHNNIDGYIEFAAIPSIGKTHLTFTTKKGRVSLDCETYVPTLLFPGLPKEYFKIRFLAPAVSLIVTPDLKMKVSWRLPDEGVPMPLSQLATATQLLSLFSDAGTGGEGVEVGYDAEGKRLKLGHSGFAGDVSPELREFASIVAHASLLAGHFDVSPDTAIDPRALEDQRSQLMALSSVFDRTKGGLSVSVQVKTGAEMAGKRIALLLPMSARLGEQVLAAIVSMSGEAVWVPLEQRLTVNNSEASVLARWTVPVSEWDAFPRVAKYAEAAKSLAQTTDDIVITADSVDDKTNDPTSAQDSEAPSS